MSGWKTGVRTPGRYAQRQLVQLAREAGLPEPFGLYPTVAPPLANIAEQAPVKPATGKHTATAHQAEWVRLLEALPEPERREVLEYARFKAGRKRGPAAQGQ